MATEGGGAAATTVALGTTPRAAADADSAPTEKPKKTRRRGDLAALKPNSRDEYYADETSTNWRESKRPCLEPNTAMTFRRSRAAALASHAAPLQMSSPSPASTKARPLGPGEAAGRRVAITYYYHVVPSRTCPRGRQGGRAEAQAQGPPVQEHAQNELIPPRP